MRLNVEFDFIFHMKSLEFIIYNFLYQMKFVALRASGFPKPKVLKEFYPLILSTLNCGVMGIAVEVNKSLYCCQTSLLRGQRSK